MASNAGGLVTKAPPPNQVNQLNIVAPTIDPSDDIVRLAKRQRESESVSPRSRAAQLPNPHASPSKAARLAFSSTQRSVVPLTGAAALEDGQRRRAQERAGSPLSISPNPAHSALESLMSGGSQVMSRPSDVTQLAPTANMEPAAKAATALSMAAGTTDRIGDHDGDEGGPPIGASATGPAPV